MAAAVVFIALTGCGGSDSDTSTATTPQAAVDATSAPQPEATAAPSNGGGGSTESPVQEGNYPTGRIHVEFGGDSSGAVEIDGTGFVTGGFANLTFADANRSAAATFALGGDQGALAVFLWDGITSQGEFGKECSVDFSKADQTALEATFTCTGMIGISSTTTTASVDAKGSFTLSAGA